MMPSKMRCASFLKAGLFFLILTGLSGCQLAKEFPPGPLYEAYAPIDHPESEQFIARALERAIEKFGEPAIPVNKILLRSSMPMPEFRRYLGLERGIPTTKCVDETNGVFVIHMSLFPGDKHYYPLLAHECGHLINHAIFDWYMEGAVTLFSEQFCDEEGLSWGKWTKDFNKSKKDPYALSYRMMRQLEEQFPDAYPLIVKKAVSVDDETCGMRIDIDAWLKLLSEEQQEVARGIIAPYAKRLGKAARGYYNFTKPEVSD